MTEAEVLTLLNNNRDERGIKNWQSINADRTDMTSYGLGLTQLRQLAKKIGRDRALAQTLWQSKVYDARVIALLIDDPKQITREQAETQVEQLAGGMLAHVFASCDATLAKTPFVVELAQQWVQSNDAVRRECGYGLMYEASKLPDKKAPSEAFFLAQVQRIANNIDNEPETVRLAMATALMGIGKRTPALNAAALAVALATGPIAFTSASGNCDPFDVSKHLTTVRLKQKLGI